MHSTITKPRSSYAQWEVVEAGGSSTLGTIRKIIPLGASFEMSAAASEDATNVSALVGQVIPGANGPLDVKLDSFTLDAASVGPVIAVGN